MDPIPIPIQISTDSSLPHRLLDARHRARDVLEERILAQKPNDARLLERLARAALEVRDVQPNTAILQTRNPADHIANAKMQPLITARRQRTSSLKRINGQEWKLRTL